MTFSAAKRLRDMRHDSLEPVRRVLLWVTLIVGFLALSFAAALRAEGQGPGGTATRRQEFTASGSLRSLTLENVNGSVEIVAGPTFRAAVELTARGRSAREARRILEEMTCRFTNENGELSLSTEFPGTTGRRRDGRWNVEVRDFDPGRVEARYTVTLPSGVPVEASLVSGPVSVKGITADLRLSTVNGRIDVSGARRGLKLHTVNGDVEASVAELPKGAELELKSVSGNLLLRLPAGAGFRFEGRTMSGGIVSTFPVALKSLPGQEAGAAARADRERLASERARAAAGRQAAHREGGDLPAARDLEELNRSLAEMSRELARMGAEIAREVSVNLHRSCEGTVGAGGATVRMSNLSGRIALLAEGTSEAQARPLLSARHARIVEAATTPPRSVRVFTGPAPPVPPPHVHAPEAPEPPEPPDPAGVRRPVVRGDVAGDFVADDVQGDVTLGRVAGRVKVGTQFGQVRVASAGRGADLSSAGGEISVDAVTGDLTATTMGGDIRAGHVSGDARLETSGGDIVVKGGGGAVTARTSAGDITLRKVRGPVVARTSGGTVLCEVVAADRPGVDVASGGGDVTLVLPANYRGDVEIRVTGVDSEGDYILSQFPEVAVVKREGLQRAEGKLGGGGPKISVHTAAGVVRLKRAPAAP